MGIYAYTAGWPISRDECVNLAAALQSRATPHPLLSSGIVLGKRKYLCLRIDADDDNGLDGYPVALGRNGGNGLCVACTASTIVVGVYSQGMSPSDCNLCVRGLAEYL